MINFKFVGKLASRKPSDKFTPYEEKTFVSGWKRRQLVFSGISGDNQYQFRISGGYFPDRSDNKIITSGPATKDDSGNTIKGERIEIPWKNRNNPDVIAKVASYKRFVIDLEERGRRTKLQRMADNIHEGEVISDEDLKAVGLNDESEVKEALEASMKLKREFLSEYDYAEVVQKLLSTSKYNNKKFYVTGTLECQWSDNDSKWYKRMKIQSIYLADDKEEDRCDGSATIYFTEDAVDDGSLEEKEKYFINAYSFEYVNADNKEAPCPFQFVIPKEVPNANGETDDKSEKRAQALVKKFIVNSGDEHPVKQYGIEFDYIEGAQKIDITEDMLTDEQKDDLDLGLITMDEIRAEMGKVYGDKVIEYRYKGVMKGFTKGRKDTSYDVDKLTFPNNNVDDSDIEDLFGDDD